MHQTFELFLFSRIFRLSRQRELDAQAEILRCGRITAARQERGVSLTVIIETHGKEFAEGIIGRETQFQSIVAAAGTAYH